MIESRIACEKSPDAAANEDYVIATPTFVAVLDGVTVPPRSDTGCIHGPSWYVRQLGTAMASIHETEHTAGLPDVLAEAIRRVATRHGATCDLNHPGTPQSTACLLRASDNQLEYLILADSPLVIGREASTEMLTDLRLRQTNQHLRELALAESSIGSVSQAERVRMLVEAQRTQVNRPGGYWIAAASPDAAYHGIHGYLPLTGPDRVTRAALLTDGAAAAVDIFELLDWQDLLDTLESQGPQRVIELVRAAEVEDGHGRIRPRYKRHDDATIAYCTFGQEDSS
ncbi:hypothetical protein R8Z50_29845 [Longispora sp. K20-0274]|uniref:hypothetical protein n=1 Tax=Longispora sp. K20-0274 TaxID=3088255 RepID=UPI00399B744C